ncbi:class III signal peptide-containing protein [Thermococcus sp. GR7]|uniref:class III signal peptide-containing protein n=1 Tax=unclassified Thermococcus TaxID=2627626 RepID=UPI0014317CAC|nr:MULTISPECIES: class III signal peptide-containing protein [unclassified Thermococcus]NJE42278.1 class III signal peptide-containing protein [Thermococcus sp. GR6]NJE46497.1 class III signal peptide-containing protein [Thermococcus sp. GR7]NJE77583.1 class III signal peptide-containing protein [Thermococcus sp. GR4]NJF23672.1 class III signal peptide-containing protein [Thermococcus sp. GR5]
MKRKAQGAIEYLFMIAAALIIILIVVRQLQSRGSTASQTIEGAETEISNVLSSMSASG